MAFSMYTASIPVFRQILGSMIGVLDKAQAHAAQKGIEPQALLQARLYPDMFPLIRQVQVACDFAKGAAARLGGVEVPKFEDTEQGFDQLKQRIARTIAFIEGVPREAIEDSAGREITTGSGDKARSFRGQDYLLHYALAHFFFHATTAYDILRHNGVELGKKDFIGTY